VGSTARGQPVRASVRAKGVSESHVKAQGTRQKAHVMSLHLSSSFFHPENQMAIVSSFRTSALCLLPYALLDLP
jgi:hypothetical protein